jgi:hypothetical protein
MVHSVAELGVVSQASAMYGTHLLVAVIVNGRAAELAPHLELSQCHAALRRCSDMLAARGKIPPARHYAAPGSRY